MGTVISGVRDEIKKMDEAVQKKANEQLGSLVKVVDSVLNKAILEAKQSGIDSKRIPIKLILKEEKLIRCNVTSSNDLDTQISSFCSSFIDGEFLKGVSSIITTAINTVLGNFIGTESKITSYFIALGSAGSILRIDYYVYAHQMKASAVTTSVSQALGVSYLISSADIAQIDNGTIRAIIELNYRDEPRETKQKMAESMIEMMNRSRQFVRPPLFPAPAPAPAPEPENAPQPIPEKAPEESPAPAPVA